LLAQQIDGFSGDAAAAQVPLRQLLVGGQLVSGGVFADLDACTQVVGDPRLDGSFVGDLARHDPTVPPEQHTIFPADRFASKALDRLYGGDYPRFMTSGLDSRPLAVAVQHSASTGHRKEA
jgi:hypothetical protein